jgi:hypothetical protein
VQFATLSRGDLLGAVRLLPTRWPVHKAALSSVITATPIPPCLPGANANHLRAIRSWLAASLLMRSTAVFVADSKFGSLAGCPKIVATVFPRARA